MIPLLTPASTNEKVTMAGNFISRTCFTDDFQGVVMAKFAKQSLGKSKAVVVIDSDSDYSKGLATVFKKKFKELGGKIVTGGDDLKYSQKATDFSKLVKKIKKLSPEVVFLPGYYTEVGPILKQARKLGLTIPSLGGDGWDSPKLQELAGPLGIKNNFISSHFSPDDQDPKVQNFVKQYIDRYKSTPGTMAALSHDGIHVLADALKRSATLNPHDIQQAIQQTTNFSGVTGNIALDENRNAKKSAYVLETTAEGNIFKQKIAP